MDYKKIYQEAYPDNDPDWLEKLDRYRYETVIPDDIDEEKALDDLYDLNNRTLREVLYEAL